MVLTQNFHIVVKRKVLRGKSRTSAYFYIGLTQKHLLNIKKTTLAMTESVLATAVEMATRSVNRFGDLLQLNTVSAAIDNPLVTTSASSSPGESSAFRSVFSLLGQSLNEKGQRLTDGFNKAFSGDNSPKNVLGRLFASPVPLRRAKSDRRRIQAQQRMRDFYQGQSRSVSSSPSNHWHRSPTESCSNKRQMNVRSTDQLQKHATDHSTTRELMNRAKGRCGAMEYKYEVDLTPKQDIVCGEIGDMNSVRLISTQDDTGAADGSASETDFDETEASKNRIRKCVGRSCFMHRQHSNEENVRKETPSEYVRQDSGFLSEGEGRKPPSCINSSYSLAIQNKDAEVDVDYGQNDNNIDPFQMISQILTAEQNEKRDLYRITRRPSQKQNGQRHSAYRSLSLGDRLLLNRFVQDRQNNDSDSNEEPKLKLSVQTFASSRQMRVIVTEITNLDKLSLQSSNTEKHIRVCLKIGKTHHKISRQVKSFDAGNLWEVFHFFDIDVEGDIPRAELRIRLCCKQRYAVLCLSFQSSIFS